MTTEAGIRRLGTTDGPNPWWHHRGPQNDQERLEYAAAMFTPDEEMERAIVIRDRYPELFASAFREVPVRLEAYEKGRAAAVELGKAVPDVDRSVVELVDAAAAVIAGERPRLDENGWRDTFRAELLEPSMDGAISVWREWRAAVEAHGRAVAAYTDAQRILFRGGQGPVGLTRPDFMLELARALGSDALRSRVWAGGGPRPPARAHGAWRGRDQRSANQIAGLGCPGDSTKYGGSYRSTSEATSPVLTRQHAAQPDNL
jgi:hypothetical protein